MGINLVAQILEVVMQPFSGEVFGTYLLGNVHAPLVKGRMYETAMAVSRARLHASSSLVSVRSAVAAAIA
jgi:hypothetical protein